MKTLALVGLVLVGTFVGTLALRGTAPATPQTAPFSAQLAAWHVKCDDWRNPADAKTPIAQTCAKALAALMADAPR